MKRRLRYLVIWLAGWLAAWETVAGTVPADLVVASDGSGDYTTVGEALRAVPDRSPKRTVIFIKPGTYREKLVVPAEKQRLTLIGENAATTILTFDDHSGKGSINTATSYTVLVKADDFRAENLTFANTAGRDAGQAVALHITGDRAGFRKCRLLGDQDTFFAAANRSRQYFKDCYIEGTTDFIFGSATVLFEDCTIHSKKNSYVTAAATPREHPFGLVFRHCRLTASPEATKVYLGRPWQDYARTVFLGCTLGNHIVPEGWHNWKKPEAEKTAFYAEYKSKGPGAAATRRVAWSRQLTRKEARQYTLKNILAGNDNWVPFKD